MDDVSAQTITSIADIQANPGGYTTVTVEGQVYIPIDYRGTVNSGYIQDASGRGINIFGYEEVNVAALKDTGNIVRITGTVDTYVTTVEIKNVTNVTLISTGNTPLAPLQLTTGAAANAAYEGTYIEVTGTISAKADGGPGTNYTINDGSGAIVARVVFTLGAPTFNVGDEVTARGAGGKFFDDFQVNVGEASGIALASSGADTTPPTLSSATASSATAVGLSFNELLDETTAETTGNYAVYQTSNITSTVAVSSATLSGSTVALVLGSALADGVDYTVAVTGVDDVAGNTIAASNTATFSYSAAALTPIATIQGDTDYWDGRDVIVRGQVFIPGDYLGVRTSAYIQDDSGKGINIFSFDLGFDELNDVGNIVEVSGTVGLNYSTTQIQDISVTLVSSDNPPLDPLVMGSISAASTRDLEGTYFEVAGEITARSTSGSSPVHYNYTISDGTTSMVVRAAQSFGATVFNVGDEIIAAGAGSYYDSSSEYQVLVGVAGDIREDVGEVDTTPPTVSAASSVSETEVQITFSETMDTATTGLAANYAVFETATPANVLTVSSVDAIGASATLTLGASMVDGMSYTVEVTGVTDDAETPNAIGASNSAAFTYSASSVVSIAEIHENLDFYWDAVNLTGREVTVRGQVYIPGNTRGGYTSSSYIQDESGRGLNIYGGSNSALNDLSAIVEVTGTVELYFTTVEIADVTEVTVISTGNPQLQPLVLNSTAQANDADFEGTYIRVTGEIQSEPTETGGALNYVVSDGSSSITVRVDLDVGAAEYAAGTTIWAAGAGSKYQSTYQITIGRADDFTDTEPADASPPVLYQVYQNAPRQITLRFNEDLDPVTASDPTNYTINVPAKADVDVLVASFTSGSVVVLTLSQDIVLADGWTVTVTGVKDLLGNEAVAPQTAEIEAAPATEVLLDGPIKTFLPREGEEYPITMILLPELVAAGAQTEISLRIFDMQGRLVLNLYDSRFTPDVQGDFEEASSHTVDWNGRDEFFDLVPAGAYVAHLLVSESTTGTRHQAQMPVVVATRLER